jgi:anaerobic magnesium-protoporphyrin IX monomethyl ester cyclase
MKVMLIQLPHFFDGLNRPAIEYPLGIGYLVSSLKDRHEMLPMDLWIENASVDKAMQMIGKNRPDVFCISVYSTQYPYFKELVGALKNAYPDTKIIAGGPGATFSCPVFLEKTKVDYCVLGEGEITLGELLDNIDDPHAVAGLAYRKDGAIARTQKRMQLKDLDSLPWPDRDFFDMERYILNYKNSGSHLKNFRTSNVIAGRGCQYNCTFCSKTFSGVRFRSIPSIKEELLHLKKKYSLGAVCFHDELVVTNKKRILELCSALKDAGIKWGCQGRINEVDEDILRAMKAAGCIYIGYGVESYSQKILDRMKKHVKVETIIPVIEMTRRIGLIPVIQYMYGFPGEDDDSIERTVEFFKKIDHPYIGSATTPIPGTELYAEALKDNLIVDEEAYLNKLTGGYNRFEPLVNMTDFSDRDLILKKMKLVEKVNYNYYKRHPAAYFRLMLKEIPRIVKVLIFSPGTFFKKLSSKFLR